MESKGKANPTRMSTKERTRRLQSICKQGKTPLEAQETAKERQRKKRKVEHLDSVDGKRFACDVKGGISDRLKQWMLAGTRVNVKLRGHAPNCSVQEPNRIIKGAIVAYDRHWNMVLRDVDEVYLPASRMSKVQSMPGAIPSPARYTLDRSKKGRALLTRNLKCSMVTGSSVIAIYCDEQQ